MSAFAGLFGVLAVTQLARLNGPDGTTTRIAFEARPVPGDPDTTGAIPAAGVAQPAQAIRLDPCVVPTAARLRP